MKRLIQVSNSPARHEMAASIVPIAAMNAILLLINAWGVWQYLLSRKNREVMERVEPIQQAIEHEVEEEIAHERT